MDASAVGDDRPDRHDLLFDAPHEHGPIGIEGHHELSHAHHAHTRGEDIILCQFKGVIFGDVLLVGGWRFGEAVPEGQLVHVYHLNVGVLPGAEGHGGEEGHGGGFLHHEVDPHVYFLVVAVEEA